MQIWPAIDLRGGKCVRLKQGDYARETVYGDDPAAVAKQWVGEGAEFLHIVDLDGARDGTRANLAAVKAIVDAVDIPCELGGGVRDEATIDAYLDLGLSRLVLGTRALREPDWFRDVCSTRPDKLVLGVDARDGKVATDGWLETSGEDAVDLARRFDDLPLAAIVYTDIAKDGMLQGANLEAMRAMNEAVKAPVIASGGVTSEEDVRRLAEIAMAGCIIGRALYEGRLTLRGALAAVVA
jgi:phosphoribosylformimino-5-aminoimidazole carboxamide ribotide isomerase